MSESVMEIDDWGNKRWKNSKGQYHRTGGPAVEYLSGDKSWYVNGEWLGYDDEGFWALWDRLTTKQKQDSILLSYLPEKF